MLLTPGYVSGQELALKTNVLTWATTTTNLSLEIGLGLKTSLDLTGTYNPWEFGSKDSNKKIKHWSVSPELRFWVYEKWDGHFFGLHPFYAYYNAGGIKLPLGIFPGLENYRYQGYAAGFGLSYGYQWYLGPHWNLEATFGFGYAYLNYDRYDCRKCGRHLEKGTKHYFGPTKIGLSFTYLFKSKNKR